MPHYSFNSRMDYTSNVSIDEALFHLISSLCETIEVGVQKASNLKKSRDNSIKLLEELYSKLRDERDTLTMNEKLDVIALAAFELKKCQREQENAARSWQAERFHKFFMKIHLEIQRRRHFEKESETTEPDKIQLRSRTAFRVLELLNYMEELRKIVRFSIAVPSLIQEMIALVPGVHLCSFLDSPSSVKVCMGDLCIIWDPDDLEGIVEVAEGNPML